MRASVRDPIRWWARARAGETAIVFSDDAVSYGELDQWTDRVAHFLDERGVQPGDNVAIAAENRMAWAAAALGIITSGGVLVPFSYRFVPAELDYLVQDCAPKLVFADAAQRAKLEGIRRQGGGPEIVDLDVVDDLRQGPIKPFVRDLEPSSPLGVIYTSGTAGAPKGVVFTHETTLNFVLEGLLRDPMRPDETRALLVLPMFTLGGSLWGLVQTLVRGGTFIIEPNFDPRRALDVIQKQRVTMMFGVPVIYEQISAVEGFEQLDLSHVEFAMVGGQRVSLELLEAWSARGVALRQLYGMTEIGGVATLTRVEDAATRPESCGTGSPFTRFKVVRPDGTTCDPEEPGEILVTGPAVTPGYWNNEQATRELVVDGWAHSGDVGVVDELGYLRFVDRRKDMIISGGFNISPMEIENVIGALPGVVQVAVIGVPDPKWGETPAAIISANAPIDIPGVVEHLNEVLADYKVPRYIVVLDDPLPLMLSGKIAKRQLRAEYADIASTHQRVR
jgi:fatty-acyl-CoA synthase